MTIVIHDVAGKYSHIDIADLRKFDRISIKCRKTELDLNFLRNCQPFNVLPKFVRVELPNVSQNDIISIRKFLLKSAVTKRAKESRKLRQTRDALSNKIKEVLTGLDFYILKRASSKNVDKAANKVIMTHQKRLEKLTRNTVLLSPRMKR